MTDQLNTHSYDGCLNNNLINNLAHIGTLDINLKKNLCLEFKERAEKYCNPLALNYLNGILNDFGTHNNIDSSNNLNADDLLALCWNYKDNEDFMAVLEQQLIDMATGFCPQGRTHRLFQVLMAFQL